MHKLKKKIVLIGFGNHFLKRIFPAINKINRLNIEYAIVRNPNQYEKKFKNLNIKFYDESKKISENTKWIYISTPMMSHFELVNKYLDENKNIICEKPLTDSLKKTNFLINKSKRKNLILHEVDMYKHHIQFKSLDKIVKQNLKKIYKVDTKFIIPHTIKSSNIYSKFLSGDTIYSLGYYPISVLITLFGEPKKIIAELKKNKKNTISPSGKVKFIYDKFDCNLEWKIGGGYKNYIKIYTKNKIFTYNKIFSKDPEFKSNFEINENDNVKEFFLGNDDQFFNMFKKIIFSSYKQKHIITKKIIRNIENIYLSSI
jgi:predicted dehydrogenase